MTTMTAARPASLKQQTFIEKLLNEKELTGTAYEGWTPDWGRATTKSASAVIDYLMALPRVKKAVTSDVEPEAGMYLLNDENIVRVYFGQQSGRMLMKIVAGGEQGSYHYDYLGLAAKYAKLIDRKLTLDEAKAWGRMTGSCCVCARRLDNPESVDAGIGPVCAKRF